MIKILLADDHALLREGLRRVLLEIGGTVKIGEVGTGTATLDKLRQERWDILILDINMPERSGLDILRHVRASYPETRVLILSAFPEKQYAVKMLRAGASGYLNKEGAVEELLIAVRAVLQGRKYMSAAIPDLLLSELDHDADQPVHARLSEREFQIFRKLAQGTSVSRVAEELSLSVKTVSTYRARALEKMGFTCNADMTAYALRNDLIT